MRLIRRYHHAFFEKHQLHNIYGALRYKSIIHITQHDNQSIGFLDMNHFASYEKYRPLRYIPFRKILLHREFRHLPLWAIPKVSYISFCTVLKVSNPTVHTVSHEKFCIVRFDMYRSGRYKSISFSTLAAIYTQEKTVFEIIVFDSYRFVQYKKYLLVDTYRNEKCS